MGVSCTRSRWYMLNSCEIWKFLIKMQTSRRKLIFQENKTLFSISGVASRAAQNKYKRLKWTFSSILWTSDHRTKQSPSLLARNYLLDWRNRWVPVHSTLRLKIGHAIWVAFSSATPWSRSLPVNLRKNIGCWRVLQTYVTLDENSDFSF